jgi:hypothetical protein
LKPLNIDGHTAKLSDTYHIPAKLKSKLPTENVCNRVRTGVSAIVKHTKDSPVSGLRINRRH